MPLLYALKQGTPAQQTLIKTSLQQGSLDHLQAILTAISETNAIEYTRQYAADEVNCALQALEPVPDSPYKVALQDLARFAVERNF